MVDERWRAIPCYEGLYEVSDHGRVRSLPRVIVQKNRWGTTTRHHHAGRMMKLWPSTNPYLRTTLSRDGETSQQLVSWLVMLAFVGPRPNGVQVCHNDGDPLNNHLGNLRYDTPVANNADKRFHGTQHAGSRVYCAKLSEADIPVIRSRIGNEPMAAIASAFGVSRASIQDIAHRRTWRHV